MIDRELETIFEILQRTSPEERAYVIIKQYFVLHDDKHRNDEVVSEKTRRMFLSWLLSPVNEEAKDKAMFRVFEECVAEGFMHDPEKNGRAS